MKWLLKLLGPALLLLLVTTTDLETVFGVLRQSDPVCFVQATACWIGIAAIKAWRWQLLLAGQSILVPYPKAAQWYLAGLFLGGISPGRLGELIKVGFVRDLGHPMGRALFSSVLDRLFDLLVLPLVALMGMALYGTMFAQELQTLATACGILVLGILVVWRAKGLVRRTLAIPVRMLMPPSMRHEASMSVDDFFHDFSALGFGAWCFYGGLTALCWVIYGAAAVLLAMGIGLDIDPVWIGIAVLSAALAGLIPITVSGIGTRDAVLAAFFTRVGASTAAAIALSTLMLGLNLAVILLYWPAYHRALNQKTKGE